MPEQVETQDILLSFREYQRIYWVTRGLILLSMVGIAIVIALLSQSQWIQMGIAAGIGLAFLSEQVEVFAKWRAAKAFYSEPHKFIISPERFQLKSSLGDSTVPRSSIRKVTQRGGFVLVEMVTRQRIPIPTRSFQTPQDLQTALGWLKPEA